MIVTISRVEADGSCFEGLGSGHRQSQLRRLEFGPGSALDLEGSTIRIADAHRNDGKRFLLRADEKLTAFAEHESAIRGGGFCIDKFREVFPTFTQIRKDLNPGCG